MNENVKDLINAIETGKSVDIQAAFEKAMSDKVYAAIEARREAISHNLLGAHDNAISEEEPPEIPDEKEGDEDSHGL